MTPTEASASHLALALSSDGLSAQHDPTGFGRIVAPNGPQAARGYMCLPNLPGGANSPCETVAVGFLAIVLAEAGRSELQEPLTGATVEWARATTLAQAHGALHSPESPGRGLRVRCVVHLEGATGRHWRTLVEDLGGGRWRCVDGTLIGGWGIVHCTECEIPGGVYDRTALKPVLNWIDADELFAALLSADVEPSDASLDGGPL